VIVHFVYFLEDGCCFWVLQDHFFLEEACRLGSEGVLLVTLERRLGEVMPSCAKSFLRRIFISVVNDL